MKQKTLTYTYYWGGWAFCRGGFCPRPGQVLNETWSPIVYCDYPCIFINKSRKIKPFYGP